MALGKLFDKGKCALGFHAGAWQYEAEGSCSQVQVCERCQKVSKRTEHTWGDWGYLQAGSCVQQRQCARCQETEQRTEHAWGQAAYVAADQCTQARVCRRCRESQPAGTLHQWENWVYLSEDTCFQVQTCSRCGVQGTEKRLQHAWGDWQPSAFYQCNATACRRCGEMLLDIGQDQRSGVWVTMQDVERLSLKIIENPQARAWVQLLRDNPVIAASPVSDKYFALLKDQSPLYKQNPQPFQMIYSLFLACRQQGVEAATQAILAHVEAQEQAAAAAAPVVQTPAAPPPAALQAQGGADARLVGHWRCTESYVSDGFSQATDYHLILEANGRAAQYNESAGSFGGGRSQVRQGRWSAEGGNLSIRFNDGKSWIFYGYSIEQRTLFCPGESTLRLWDRVA